MPTWPQPEQTVVKSSPLCEKLGYSAPCSATSPRVSFRARAQITTLSDKSKVKPGE